MSPPPSPPGALDGRAMLIPCALTIAGLDPSGGAGIAADVRTFAAHGVHACTVATALTVQNTQGVADVYPVPPDVVARQLAAVLSDIDIRVIKIGMLGTAANAHAVAAVLRDYQGRATGMDAHGRTAGIDAIILDPILRAGTGATLLDEDGLAVLREELLPLTLLVTPNAPEAGALLGTRPPATDAETDTAARGLVALGARYALVTGGHRPGLDSCADILSDGITRHEFRVPRVVDSGRSRGVESAARHGTGCTLTAAIAARLVQGHDLVEACQYAQRFVADAIAHSEAFAIGHGTIPVHQLHALWREHRNMPSFAKGPG